MALATAVLLVAMAATVQGFPTGPPAFACLNLQPMHARMDGPIMFLHPPTTGNDYATIQLNASTWGPNDTISVTLMATGIPSFKGFILRATRASMRYTDGDMGPLIGNFMCENSANVSMRTHSLYSPMNDTNCVTHMMRMDYTNVTCTWKAPATDEGPIMFSGTIMRRFDQYQYVWSRTLNSTGAMMPPNTYASSEPMTSVPSVSGCGQSKACALYPPLCDIKGSCTHGVIMTGMSGDMVMIEMFGASTDWIGMGIGLNTNMTELELYVCTYDIWMRMVTLETAYSPSYSVRANHRPMITQRRGMVMYNQSSSAIPMQPTMLACSFVRPVNEIYTVYEYDRKTKMNTAMPMMSRLSDGRNVVLAQGNWIGGDSKMTAQHNFRPLTTPMMMMPSMPTKMYFKGMSTKVQTHGTLMTIAWLFLVGLAIIIARHTRPILGQKLVLNKGLWFLLHILFTLSSFIISIAGIAYLLIQQEGWEEDSQGHGIVGMIAMGLALINILAGLFRPAPESQYRWVFNILHRYNGIVALVFATVAMWLGATFRNNRPEFVFWSVIVLGVWTGLQLLFMFAFECLRQSRARNEEFKRALEQKYKMHSANGEPEAAPEAESQKPVKGKEIRHVSGAMLLLYGAVFFAIAAAFWSGLWLH